MRPFRLPRRPDLTEHFSASAIAHDPLRRRRLATPLQLALDLKFARVSGSEADPRTMYIVAECDRAIRHARAWRSMLNRATDLLRCKTSPLLIAALADTCEVERAAVKRRARLLGEPDPEREDWAPM